MRRTANPVTAGRRGGCYRANVEPSLRTAPSVLTHQPRMRHPDRRHPAEGWRRTSTGGLKHFRLAGAHAEARPRPFQSAQPRHVGQVGRCCAGSPPETHGGFQNRRMRVSFQNDTDYTAGAAAHALSDTRRRGPTYASYRFVCRRLKRLGILSCRRNMERNSQGSTFSMGQPASRLNSTRRTSPTASNVTPAVIV